MKRRRHRFPTSTHGRHRPSVGITITQANIAAHFPQALPDAEAVVKFFTPRVPGCEHLPPSKRHLARANRLLHGGS